jgi:hypothetical protein
MATDTAITGIPTPVAGTKVNAGGDVMSAAKRGTGADRIRAVRAFLVTEKIMCKASEARCNSFLVLPSFA